MSQVCRDVLSRPVQTVRCGWRVTPVALAFLLEALLLANVAQAQVGLFRGSAVGGVAIDAEGVLRQPAVADLRAVREQVLQAAQPVPEGLSRFSPSRKISLRRLEQALVVAASQPGEPIPDDIRYLAGLQRIEAIVVDTDAHDILLVGPADGWTLDERSVMVGQHNGLPTLLLDDLLVAFRSMREAASGNITCSIDPTPAGLQAVQNLLRRQKTFQPAVIRAIEEAMGPQQITVQGIPSDSHFARVMVGADYRMKRIAMNLEPAPIAQLPGFLDLVASKRGKLSTMTPRWWMACNYQTLLRDQAGLTWQLQGQGVKVMTEADVLGNNGQVQHTGKRDPLAQQWADLMTQHFEALATADPLFGQVRNLMDLCVATALIEKEGLLERAALDLPMLRDAQSSLAVEQWPAPKTVATQGSFVRQRGTVLITASGGVDIDFAAVLQKVEQSPQLEQLGKQSRTAAPPSWAWD